MAAEKNAPLVSANRQAYHDYFIHETYECGIALTGTEVKSIRAGRVNLRDSFARVQKGEVFLWNAHISPYEQGNIFNHDPLRTRKLLLHKKEILKIENTLKTKGYTLVPLKMYFRHGKIKVEIGLATGKSCTTSGRTWQRKRRSAIWRGGSKNSGMIELKIFNKKRGFFPYGESSFSVDYFFMIVFIRLKVLVISL